VINLRLARKRKQRDERAKQADENRRLYGLTKFEKNEIKSTHRKLVDTVENHKLLTRRETKPRDPNKND